MLFLLCNTIKEPTSFLLTKRSDIGVLSEAGRCCSKASTMQFAIIVAKIMYSNGVTVLRKSCENMQTLNQDIETWRRLTQSHPPPLYVGSFLTALCMKRKFWHWHQPFLSVEMIVLGYVSDWLEKNTGEDSKKQSACTWSYNEISEQLLFFVASSSISDKAFSLLVIIFLSYQEKSMEGETTEQVKQLLSVDLEMMY